MIQYILFDLDGTLTDSQEGITKSVQYALDSIGIHEPDLKKLTRFIGPSLVYSFKEFYQLSDKQITTAVQKYRERFSKTGIFENHPYPGIPDLLAALKNKGVKMAIASGKPTVFVKQILDKFELSQYFDIAVGSRLDGSTSEKKDIINEVLTYWNHPSTDQLLMVGDRKYDVIGAKKTGMPCVGVRFGFAEPGELEEHGACYIADTVSDLKNYLMKVSTAS